MNLDSVLVKEFEEALGKDVDLFLYPVSSLVPKLVLVIQFSLPVIKPPTH